VIGGGLAGSEAAWQLAERGFSVALCEMRPNAMTPAHETGGLAEIVCSNSLGADRPTSPAGILKDELRRMNSLLMRCAEQSRVPAGNALAVDRTLFSKLVEDAITSHPKIRVVREEVTEIPEEPAIIATGPLTSGVLAEKLQALVGDSYLYFFDAVAPIVTLESVDPARSFRGSRYGGDGDYINCPMDEETYHAFWEALVSAEVAAGHEFEQEMRHFEGCLPVEVIAKRGEKTLLFGPLRPVGLTAEGEEMPCAVVQLRQDNEEGTLYNLVGFQTNLKWGEQERVFRMIPALHDAEFVRKGVMHKNLFVCAPEVLDGSLRPKGRDALFLAGQMTGVEGYVESTATGMASAVFMAKRMLGKELPVFPEETAIGALLHYLKTAIPKSFQPMNVNLGIFPKLPDKKIRKKTERSEAYAKRSMEKLEEFILQNSDVF
jgi:methylenetetrahydrofolate--tRNA-(uracil-5-)-methyltransferase